MSVLKTLLDAGAAFDCEYRGGLSDHRPMALVALKRLGASDDHLIAWAARYDTRLQPAPPAEPWPPGDAWADQVGQRDKWPAFRSHFAEWIEYEGSDLLLPVVGGLMRGCGAAAFHGLIRTAYAVQTGHARELADALAYWACRFLPLDGTQLPQTAERGLIFQAMQRAAARRGFDARVTSVTVDDTTLPRLAHDAARFYAATGDFTVLHLVTSAHAMRVLLPFLDEPLAAVRHYLRAVFAAVDAAGAKPGPDAGLRPWDTLVAAALASDDEHLIKLVDSCREETAAYGGDAWQRAATRAVVDAEREAQART